MSNSQEVSLLTTSRCCLSKLMERLNSFKQQFRKVRKSIREVVVAISTQIGKSKIPEFPSMPVSHGTMTIAAVAPASLSRPKGAQEENKLTVSHSCDFICT